MGTTIGTYSEGLYWVVVLIVVLTHTVFHVWLSDKQAKQITEQQMFINHAKWAYLFVVFAFVTYCLTFLTNTYYALRYGLTLLVFLGFYRWVLFSALLNFKRGKGINYLGVEEDFGGIDPTDSRTDVFLYMVQKNVGMPPIVTKTVFMVIGLLITIWLMLYFDFGNDFKHLSYY